MSGWASVGVDDDVFLEEHTALNITGADLQSLPAARITPYHYEPPYAVLADDATSDADWKRFWMTPLNSTNPATAVPYHIGADRVFHAAVTLYLKGGESGGPVLGAQHGNDMFDGLSPETPLHSLALAVKSLKNVNLNTITLIDKLESANVKAYKEGDALEYSFALLPPKPIFFAGTDHEAGLGNANTYTVTIAGAHAVTFDSLTITGKLELKANDEGAGTAILSHGAAVDGDVVIAGGCKLTVGGTVSGTASVGAVNPEAVGAVIPATLVMDGNATIVNVILGNDSTIQLTGTLGTAPVGGMFSLSNTGFSLHRPILERIDGDETVTEGDCAKFPIKVWR
jgi:hypothetical protein